MKNETKIRGTLVSDYALNLDGFLPFTSLSPQGQFGSMGKVGTSLRSLPLLQRGSPLVSLHPQSQV